MKYIFIPFLILFFTLSSGWSQIKKIKLKGEKSVSYYYVKDSSSLEHKENCKVLYGFNAFYKAISQDNYQAYLDALSPTTLKRIALPKLERKFLKFKGYAVSLIGKIQIRSIHPFPNDTPENNPVYVCTVKLPPGQEIVKRVGFDPLKKATFEGASNHVALHLVSTDLGYKVVVLW